MNLMSNMKDINRILAKTHFKCKKKKVKKNHMFAKTCLPVMHSLLPHLLRQLKNNQNQTNTTGAQNLKEFNNTAGWLSVFFVFFFVMN